MELKVGTYVRTKRKGIFKLDDSLYYNEDFKEYWFKAPTDYGNNRTTEKSVIISSPRIIDLIQEGDYVNGYLVEKIEEVPNEEIGKIIIFNTDNIDGYDYWVEKLQENQIKSIVTKEQFEQMEYRTGDDKL